MDLSSILFSQWTIAIIIAAYVYFAYRKRQSTPKPNYFEKRGIPFKKAYPIVGSMGAVFFQKESIYDFVLNSYNMFKNKSFYGLFEFDKPLISIRDPELIKRITVKDFEHFLDHRSFLADAEQEPLFGKSLFLLTGKKWRDMRATLSPAFTGSKMRQMFQLVVECAEYSTQVLLKNEKETTDMKDLFTRYTSDVIATAAFGIKVNSLDDKNNDFYVWGKKSVDFSSTFVTVKLTLLAMFPTVCKYLNIGMFSSDQRKFYTELVHDTIRHRQKEGIIRPDMIHLLMEARKGTLRQEVVNESGDGFATVEEVGQEELGGIKKTRWDDEDLTAQCFLFLIAGFETSALLLCLAANEIMENKDVQEKLIEEVDAAKNKLAGKPLDYDVLQKMKYLDMVVSETLRKWPPVSTVDRLCIKPYEIEDESGHKVLLEKGDGIWIPVVGLHRDPNHFSDPNRFDPERFGEERKHEIKPFTYLPFGSGPRNCIGSRFALMECKALIYYLLSAFTFEVAPNSTIPMKLANSGFTVAAENGFNVHLKPRH